MNDNPNLDTLRRVALLIRVVDAVEKLVGPVIPPTASSDLFSSLRDLRAFDGRLKENFEDETNT